MSSMRVNEDELYLHIGVRLQKKRKALKMSQQEVGERVGLGRASVSQIEAGEQQTSLRVLYDICIVLGLEPSEIMPTIAETTTNLHRESVVIHGKQFKVTRRVAKIMRKLAESDVGK
jgi:transcriptional regulator with XRE-family HTH domain